MNARWNLRSTEPELAARYLADGHWTDDTLAPVLDETLRANAGFTLQVWSDTRPYRGRVREVRELARRVATGLIRLGIGPVYVVRSEIQESDVVSNFQCSAVFPKYCCLHLILPGPEPRLIALCPRPCRLSLTRSSLRSEQVAEILQHRRERTLHFFRLGAQERRNPTL